MAFSIFLARAATPCRWEELEGVFFKSKAVLCELFYEVLEVFTSWSKSLVMDYQPRLWEDRAAESAAAIKRKTSTALENCVGFIDGSLLPIARPSGILQRATFSGHKRTNGLKWQAVVGPDGIVMHLFGPVEGRRHDMTLFQMSGLETKVLDLQISNKQYCIAGDSGYVLREFLVTPYTGTQLSDEQRLFNKTLSSARIAVEWVFGNIKDVF